MQHRRRVGVDRGSFGRETQEAIMVHCRFAADDQVLPVVPARGIGNDARTVSRMYTDAFVVAHGVERRQSPGRNLFPVGNELHASEFVGEEVAVAAAVRRAHAGQFAGPDDEVHVVSHLFDIGDLVPVAGVQRHAEESRSGQRSAVDLGAVIVGLTVALERFGTVGLSVVAEDRQLDVAFAAADAVERRYRIGNAFQHAFGDRRESPAVPAGDDEAFRGEA